jgi:transposase
VLIESIVRQTLGLKDHRVVTAVASAEGLVIELAAKHRRRLPCSKCQRRSRVRDQLAQRAWRHAPLWGIAVVLVYAPWRVDCTTCGVHVEAIPWSAGKSPISVPLVVMLATWARLLAWEVVAVLFRVSWSTVRSAVQRAVEYGLARRDESEVYYLGIDEISRRRGHVYHTQVYDLVGKRLLWSGEGRKAETLQRFFDEWGAEKTARIRGICCDMWAPYIEVIKKRAPKAVLVFDKFHIVRHLLDAVSDVRRDEALELSKTNPELLKGTRYLFLKNPWNLTEPQRQRLGFLERLNLKVNRAYLLKETLCTLWLYRVKGWARRFLHRWFWWATHSRLKPLRDFAWMLRRHEDGVLAWFKVPIDNGATEAMNNNAKAVSHRAHGYRTAKTFILSLLHCLGKLPLPQTVHRFS